jgi:hypothetical protein
MNSLWVNIKTAICAANKHTIPQVWISRHTNHKQLYESPESYLAARKVSSILLLFKPKLIQAKEWHKGSKWTEVTNTMAKITDKMKLAPITFPPVLTDLSVLEVKRNLIDTYKTLSNLAKIDTHNLKVSAIKQLVDK